MTPGSMTMAGEHKHEQQAGEHDEDQRTQSGPPHPT